MANLKIDAKDSLITHCYPKKVLFKNVCLIAFITLDTTLNTEELLNHYKYRWPIEPFLKKLKNILD